MYRLVLLRHGESTWNQQNRFTGWHDVDLTPVGFAQAKLAGQLLKDNGFEFDIAYSSVLVRAMRTLWLVLDEMHRLYLPVERSWRLNERHYGALTGLNKAETAAKHGEEQVKIWRRSFDIPPPLVDESSEYYSGHDRRYAHLNKLLLPRGESLALTIERVLPYWYEVIAPSIKVGNQVLVVAHGNSLRALVKHLENMCEREIMEVNIPTGVPLVYELDRDLKAIKCEYLGDAQAIQTMMEAVSRQGKAQS